MNRLPKGFFTRGSKEQKKFVALYGVFCQMPDGSIMGYTENSFSMSWSFDKVRLWTKETALLYIEEFHSKPNPDGRKYFIYRLTRKSKSARITADFTDYLRNPSKYTYRNVTFKINGGGLVDACN